MAEKLVALVLRHGEASANAMGIFRSWLDVPLTADGLRQAHGAANFLKQFQIKHVICSPLLRAFVTACIVAGPHKLATYQHRGLFPWRLGVFTGLPKDENQAALHLFVANSSVAIPAGESLDEFEDRQFEFWKVALAMAAREGLTLYVTHNSTITALINMTEPNRKADAISGENIKPGGIGAIYFDGKHHRVQPIFGEEEPARFGGS